MKNYLSKKILTFTAMNIKTVKVSDKGQISIPTEIRNSAGIKKGDELIIMQEGSKILIERPERLKKIAKDSFRDLLVHSESVAKKLWANKKDEIWDKL